MIIMLVCTFDPLAVALLIAANHAYMNRNDKRVRSEFSILEDDNASTADKAGLDTFQNKELRYADLTEEEKLEQRRKVDEYLKALDAYSENVSDSSEKKAEKYRQMISDEQTGDSDVIESSDESSKTESPYSLNKIEDDVTDEVANVQKNSKTIGNRFNWLPRRNPPKE